MTELVNHAPPNLTITPIERFQISDRGFLEIRNYGEIIKKLLRVGHDLPILSWEHVISMLDCVNTFIIVIKPRRTHGGGRTQVIRGSYKVCKLYCTVPYSTVPNDLCCCVVRNRTALYCTVLF